MLKYRREILTTVTMAIQFFLRSDTVYSGRSVLTFHTVGEVSRGILWNVGTVLLDYVVF